MDREGLRMWEVLYAALLEQLMRQEDEIEAVKRGDVAATARLDRAFDMTKRLTRELDELVKNRLG